MSRDTGITTDPAPGPDIFCDINVEGMFPVHMFNIKIGVVELCHHRCSGTCRGRLTRIKMILEPECGPRDP